MARGWPKNRWKRELNKEQGIQLRKPTHDRLQEDMTKYIDRSSVLMYKC